MALTWRIAVAFCAMATVAASQTHSFGKLEIEEGRRVYRTYCIGCHGGDGASVGGVDLARGKMKRVSTDEQLGQVIVQGVPGTGMPPTPLPPARVSMLVAYLRNMNSGPVVPSIAAAQGDAARGKELFFHEANCHSCHRIGAAGGRSGPPLGEAGLLLRPIEIEVALLDPDASYALTEAPMRFTLRQGPALEGFLLNQDSATVQLITRQGQLKSVERAELQASAVIRSWMPSYRGKLNPQQLADLIAFLGTQKGTP